MNDVQEQLLNADDKDLSIQIKQEADSLLISRMANSIDRLLDSFMEENHE